MNKETYELMENYMRSCMGDSAHDQEHIYRVLYNALDIARTEEKVDYDILIAACLLHDIGRKEQFENPDLCHAKVGGDKAYCFLTEHGFASDYAEQVKQCIRTHRYRRDTQPQSLEARILFDADKLDVAGAIGIARTLIYKGAVSEPLYSVSPDKEVLTGENDTAPSFFQEYKYKLEKLYSDFYTNRAAEIAGERQQSAIDFYNALYHEACTPYQNGRKELEKRLE
ncbi:MAG: HD domain-containing protein [Lachnospiraceae bacterium]|nr:HD domain-containing protein [Lachnospiraceae bacterium]MDE7272925.1 HD domain-containing protein [Lachnospiraceae bacterium]